MRSGPLTQATAWLAAGCVASLVSCLRGAPDASTPSPANGETAAAGDPKAATGNQGSGAGDVPHRPADGSIGPARIFPDVGGSSSGVISVQADGTRQLIVAGIRVLDHPDGSMERAREVLPNGSARVVTVPSRLGGGLLVY